ncbi:MAG: TerC family protein [Acidobacteria bacterium]|nr:TerC family protein [Acidobacteriota bacterium]
MSHPVWHYALFILFVLGMLALDLGVFHRRAHAVGRKEALLWSIVWVALSLLFNAGIWYYDSKHKALEFFTGYLIEKSLSLDNLFVFLMIFLYFGVPDRYQHRVLYWGIVGAIVMRMTLIFVGAALLAAYSWIIYVFGLFLIFTGVRFAFHSGVSVHPEANPVLRLLRRVIPITKDFHAEHFFVRQGGRWYATPLLVVLVLVETSDVLFAVDSIPAIFAITRDTFIVLTSNIFAILGLRAMYFLLANIMPLFRYLNVGLGIVLTYVGIKMLLSDVFPIPVWVSLVFIAIVLGATLGLSVWVARRESRAAEEATDAENLAEQRTRASQLPQQNNPEDKQKRG